MSEFILIISWIHAVEFIMMKSYIMMMNWCVCINPWIQWYEEHCHCEIMAEFLYMTSHMKSGLNSNLNSSIILNWSGFSFKSGNSLKQIWNRFFAVSSQPTLRLLHCCSVATGWRCCNSRRRVLLCTADWAEWGGLGGPFKVLSTWWTSLASRSAVPPCHCCQQWRKPLKPSSWETIKGINLKHNIQREQLDVQKAFKLEKADDSREMHNSEFRPNNDVGIHWGRFSWRMLSTLLLTAALCQQRHKKDAGHYSNWESSRSSNL